MVGRSFEHACLTSISDSQDRELLKLMPVERRVWRCGCGNHLLSTLHQKFFFYLLNLSPSIPYCLHAKWNLKDQVPILVAKHDPKQILVQRDPILAFQQFTRLSSKLSGEGNNTSGLLLCDFLCASTCVVEQVIK